MGATVKVLATYDTAFWRQRGYSGEAVSDSGPFSVVFDNCDDGGVQPALLGFVVGQPARAFGDLSAADRRRAALSELARLFGSEAQSPIDYVEQDWAAEPWTLGCPVGVMGPGVLTTCGPALRRPVGRIHWAGTETATEWTGYMEGAAQSGERAAREVLEAGSQKSSARA
jgi:monoamine oxidase